MRLELTRPNGHYPLKVARLPIPPSLHSCPVSQILVWFCAQNRTRTCTSLNTRTWNERVYHSATWAYTDSSVVDTNSNLWAENETRTRDPNLGKVMLYQLSYFRNFTLLFLQYFKEQSVSFPFCECKGTAFFWTTKQILKKSAKNIIFSSKSAQHSLSTPLKTAKMPRFHPQSRK